MLSRVLSARSRSWSGSRDRPSRTMWHHAACAIPLPRVFFGIIFMRIMRVQQGEAPPRHTQWVPTKSTSAPSSSRNSTSSASVIIATHSAMTSVVFPNSEGTASTIRPAGSFSRSGTKLCSDVALISPLLLALGLRSSATRKE
ncbi:hypothetical protein FIBSPDRAFT_183907 [Athelia psychrophila]|uniref:Uncharacterized protein n=1 Tax=Athelia psychrophila TaxID=1759441 RepID=A0A166AER0_9AGAM|nr:hypothetical protein FIBSPDRAFT_183907 [Fibularhizoctonia sp. CBS 109695]